ELRHFSARDPSDNHRRHAFAKRSEHARTRRLPSRAVILAVKLLLAPLCVVLVSLCARRFGPLIGGIAGGLPGVAGPILFVLAEVHGTHFAAQSARGSTSGLVSLS